MNDMKDDRRDEGLDQEEDNLIVLTDEDGAEVEFEFCDAVEYNNTQYVVLLPVEDEDGEVVILEVQEDDAGEDATYLGVEDEAVLEAVFEEFKRRNEDVFDFEN